MASCKKGEECFRESRKEKDVLFFLLLQGKIFILHKHAPASSGNFLLIFCLCNLLMRFAQDVCFNDIIRISGGVK